MELKLRKIYKFNTDISKLLIVPYGIETVKVMRLGAGDFSFNRTLWN